MLTPYVLGTPTVFFFQFQLCNKYRLLNSKEHKFHYIFRMHIIKSYILPQKPFLKKIINKAAAQGAVDHPVYF